LDFWGLCFARDDQLGPELLFRTADDWQNENAYCHTQISFLNNLHPKPLPNTHGLLPQRFDLHVLSQSHYNTNTTLTSDVLTCLCK